MAPSELLIMYVVVCRIGNWSRYRRRSSGIASQFCLKSAEFAASPVTNLYYYEADSFRYASIFVGVLTQRRSRGRLRSTLISFAARRAVIVSAISFISGEFCCYIRNSATNENSVKFTTQAHRAAAGGGDIFHGVRRPVGDRGDRAGLRLQAGAVDSGSHAAGLEPAHVADGRRTLRRNSRRRRFLCVGAPRHGTLLGFPGIVALAGREPVRHGFLS